ncbi:hypothetical protein [Gluconacetobacter tumulisoli]|uniref:Uncharacterized protein n=1 Tax=Gluconacetobacter tumulisoli TaxID=1286189 RepID=A0A7W4K977_9PROT|nr:hypothetical protein [Gluconacetobacter tumulisoli]MBB2202686.1 hypothetical protein [Gluconacetobacter tumulisoli]
MQRHLSTGPALIAALLALHRHTPTPGASPGTGAAGQDMDGMLAAASFPLLPFPKRPVPKRQARRTGHDPVRTSVRAFGTPPS